MRRPVHQARRPDNATYLDTYAWIFFVQGNYTLAKIYIESALEKDTTKEFGTGRPLRRHPVYDRGQGQSRRTMEKAREMGKEAKYSTARS